MTTPHDGTRMIRALQHAGAPPLVARAAELGAVLERIDATARGTGRVLVVEGPAGMGKTRLVDETEARATHRGMRMFRGVADELTRHNPFAPIVAALRISRESSDPRRRAIARLLRGEAPTPEVSFPAVQAAELEFRLLANFETVLEHECSQAPACLVLEDLHWADAATLTLVRCVWTLTETLPLLLVFTTRPVPRPAGLERLLAAAAARGDLVELAPLADDAVGELAASLLGAPPGPRLRQQLARAGGNPLFLTEVLEGLVRGRSLHLEDGVVEVVGPVTSPPLASTVLRRLSFLPPDALELLRLASILGHEFTARELAVISARPVATLAEALRSAVVGGALVERAGRLAFRHEVLREALYEDLPQSVREALHLEAAHALAASGAPAENVAEHLVRGAQPGDEEAIQWLERAGRQASTRAPAVAAELLDRALDLAGPEHPAYDDLLGEKIVVLLWLGRLGEAEPVARDLLCRERDPERAGRLRLFLARALVGQGRASEVLELAGASLADPRLPPRIRADLLAETSAARLLLGEAAAARAAGEQALEVASAVGYRAGECFALSALALGALVQGRPRRAATLADAAVRAAEQDDTGHASRHVQNVMLGIALLDSDRFDEADDALRAGLRSAERLGSAAVLPAYQSVVAVLRFETGAWGDAVAEAEAGLALAEQFDFWLTSAWAYAVLARIAFHTGDLACARARIATAATTFARAPVQYRPDWVAWASASLAEAAGEQDAALAILEGAWQQAAALDVALEPGLLVDLVRLAVAAGRLEPASAAAAALAERAEREGTPSLRAAALRARAVCERDVTPLLDAVDVLRDSPRLLVRARACEDAALLLSSSQRADGVRLLTDALELYEHLAAGRDVARVEAALRALGVRRGRSSARRRAVSGWEALTASEQRVAALVAEGLSNDEIAERLYISRNTVRTHISHTLRKLNLKSRVELAAWVARR